MPSNPSAPIIDDSLSDDPLDDYAGHFSLPFTPTFGNLPEIEQRIQLAATLPNTRASVIKYILNNQYLPKLLPLVQEAEDLESLEDLHRFCNIMKHIILLNDNNIMELIVSDAVIDGVLTALECMCIMSKIMAEKLLTFSFFRLLVQTIPIFQPTKQIIANFSTTRAGFGK